MYIPQHRKVVTQNMFRIQSSRGQNIYYYLCARNRKIKIKHSAPSAPYSCVTLRVAHTQTPAKINTNTASYSQLVLKSNMPASAYCRESHSGPDFFCIFSPTWYAFCKVQEQPPLATAVVYIADRAGSLVPPVGGYERVAESHADALCASCDRVSVSAVCVCVFFQLCCNSAAKKSFSFFLLF